jgi:hypothetical protein
LDGAAPSIRVDFPGYSGEKELEAIPWDEWFAKFEEQQLAFLYQNGKNTNFNKLVRRDPDQVRPSDMQRRPSRTTRGGRAAARALSARHTSSARASKRRSSDGRRTPQRASKGAESGARANTRRTSNARTNASRARTHPARAQRSRTQRTQASSVRARSARGTARPSSDMTKAELYRMAGSVGVPNRSTMSKSELLRALAQQQR